MSVMITAGFILCGSQLKALGDTPTTGCAHLCRESWWLPVVTGLRAAGVDRTREQGWWPVGTGDSGVSGVSVSAALPPSKNTSLAPTALGPAGPGDITKEGRAGLTTTNPGQLDDEPPPAAAGVSVTWATGPWLSAGGGTTVEPPSLSRSRCSSVAFCSAFPSLN